MVYEKQNFVNGQKLDASHLNAIEDGIVDINRFLTGENIIFSQIVTTSLSSPYVVSPAPFTLIEGVTYKVTIDGVQKELVCKKNTVDGMRTLCLISTFEYGIHYFTPEVCGIDGGKLYMSLGMTEDPISKTVEIHGPSTDGSILQMRNGQAQWVEPSNVPSGESSDVPDVTTEDNGKILQVVNGEWKATELEIPSGSSGSSGSAEVPVFDLASRGVPAVTLPQGTSQVEGDMSDIVTALSKGSAIFKIPVSLNGMTISISLTMQAFTDGSGGYQCVSMVAQDVMLMAIVSVTSSVVQVLVAPAVTFLGLPFVTGANNGQIMQVVNGTWTSVPVAESAVKTYVDEYLSAALEGDY